MRTVTIQRLLPQCKNSSPVVSTCLAVLIFLACLSGCTLGPNYIRPSAPVAEQWLEVSDAQLKPEPVDDAEWWAVLNDPVLNSLVTQAYVQNLSLQQAGLRILQARARLGIAVGEFYPQVQDATGSYTRSHISTNVAGLNDLSRLPFIDLDRGANTFITGFDTGWELDLWGKFWRNITAQNAEVLAAIASYDDVLVSLVAEVAATYIELRTLEERLRLARENVQIQTRSVQITDVRFRNGAVTELDVTQATSLLRNTEALIPELEAQIRQAQNALSVLLGRPPRTLNDVLGGTAPIPALPAEVAVGLPADLLRRRPDIRRAERQMAAQSERIGIAQAELYPAFSILGSFTFSAEDIDDVFEGRSTGGVVGPVFSWPVFNYGRLKNNVRFQDARFQELVVSYQDTILQAAQEVEDALIGYLRTQTQVAFLADSVEASKRSVDLSLIQYRDGAIDYTRVLDSQEFLVQQQDRLAASQGAIALNLIAVYKALGGGWQMREGQVFVADQTQQAMQQRTHWGALLPEVPDAPPEERQEWWWPLW